jgi:hypothetical protein
MSTPPTCPACGGPLGGCLPKSRRPLGTVAVSCGLVALAALSLIALRLSGGRPAVGPPAGWSDVYVADGKFRSYFPGELRRGVAGYPDARGQTARYYGSRALDEPTVQVFVHDPPAGEAAPATPEQWDAAAPEFLRSLQANRNWRVIDKIRVTQAGRPALEVHAKAAWVDAAVPPATARTGVADAVADGPKAEWWPSWVVYRIVPDGRRLYVVWVEQQGRLPDPGVLETVWSSFTIC